jgi:hypothetical protein
MTTRSARAPGALALLLAAVAACGGASGSSPAAATPEADATVTPSRAAATPSTSGPLEDLVPDEVGGIKLTKEVVHGPDIGELDPADAANFGKVLENVEGPPEAFTAVSGTGDGLAVAAWRMEGTDGGQLGDAFIGFIMGLGAAEVEDVTVGGKEMKRVTPANTTPIHIYVTGEVMFVVQAEDPELVEEAFAALP